VHDGEKMTGHSYRLPRFPVPPGTTMQETHGLWPLAPKIRNAILDYLATTQPPSTPGLDAGKQSPWAAPLYRPNPLW